jgi:cysteine desulfurase
MQTIYMDNAATTRLDPLVLETMLPYFTERYGNAASRVHRYGWEAEEASEIARGQIASALGADPREIVVTSGATESDNLALKGVMAAYRTRGRHLVTTAIEHSAILDTAKALAADGCEVTILPVDAEGRVEPDAVARAIRSDTVLVSIIHANNETGVLQDVPALAEVCRERGVLFHTDATQSLGKIPLDVNALRCDLLSVSAHKIYGPKGVGALYVRRRDPRVRLVAQMDGGGHEREVRSGTLNVPGLVGFGKACELAVQRLAEDVPRIEALRDRLESELLERLVGVARNTPPSGRAPHVLNLSIRALEGEALLLGLRTVALSSGSACASASPEPSHVLLALGRSPAEARSALRFSLGRFNTAEEVEIVIEEVCRLVEELRALRRQ